MKNRHYTFENLINNRDLGGYDTKYNKKTLERKYIRGTAKGTLKEEEKEYLTVDNYLFEIGVTKEQINVIRANLLGIN